MMNDFMSGIYTPKGGGDWGELCVAMTTSMYTISVCIVVFYFFYFVPVKKIY